MLLLRRWLSRADQIENGRLAASAMNAHTGLRQPTAGWAPVPSDPHLRPDDEDANTGSRSVLMADAQATPLLLHLLRTATRKGTAKRIYLDHVGPWVLTGLALTMFVSNLLARLYGLVGQFLSSVFVPVGMLLDVLLAIQVAWAVATLLARRGGPAGTWDAITDSLGMLVPRPVAALAVLETRVCLSLPVAPFRVIALRLRARSGGRQFRSPLRLPVRGIALRLAVELPAVMVAGSLLGAPRSAVVWAMAALPTMIAAGCLVAAFTCPHTLHAGVLRVQGGLGISVDIPLFLVDDVDVYEPPSAARSEAFGIAFGEYWAVVGGGGLRPPFHRRNRGGIAGWARLRLSEPLKLRRVSGLVVPTTVVHIEVDDARGFVGFLKDCGIGDPLPVGHLERGDEDGSLRL